MCLKHWKTLGDDEVTLLLHFNCNKDLNVSLSKRSVSICNLIDGMISKYIEKHMFTIPWMVKAFTMLTGELSKDLCIRMTNAKRFPGIPMHIMMDNATPKVKNRKSLWATMSSEISSLMFITDDKLSMFVLQRSIFLSHSRIFETTQIWTDFSWSNSWKVLKDKWRNKSM